MVYGEGTMVSMGLGMIAGLGFSGSVLGRLKMMDNECLILVLCG